MSTNVSIEFERARKKHQDARTDLERLQALLEMKSACPSHKGGENLKADILKRISRLKADIEKQKTQKAKKGSGASIAVKKEGAGQIVLVGMPNSGKSSLLKALTGVEVQIAPFEFTTIKPEKGMMKFEQVQVQLVELPAIIQGSSEGKANGTQVISLARNADAVCLVLNSNNAVKEYEIIVSELKKANILLNQKRPKIIVQHSKFPGISITGRQFLKCSLEDFEGFLKTLGFQHANVILEEPTRLETLSKALDEKLAYKKALLVCMRNDYSQVHELEAKSLQKAIVIDGLENSGKVEELKERLFQALGKIRVFTKRPGRQADFQEPLVLGQGSNIEDAARHLHKDFASGLKFAKVWGSSRFPGQRVQKDYELKDKDVVEFSA
ncbi:MAG: 50S ribosome-binding GTPase [Candidatus Diapherotrites archaeon]|uniref:50S ribosome-binding GTPase n=1 Tax=Candidatus Iainarchaeum sp. TaxID=3101447 RepID=A0A8T4KRU1_9ARCH|nr:50S ribosome-binding GTPase [Candidatus Diapherotrites archaeon]